ncbi:MAG: c-type cytochrome [Lentisphaeria bacterium]|nr:hypothetical protein [Lentisphaeria bacterium]NQZ67800.1 c-type cytochrome [Lentisphaeria bacterium]
MLKYLIATLIVCSLSIADEATDKKSFQVYKLFQEKCSDCHGGHKKKPKEFGYILDLKRLAENPDYISKGDAEESELYKLLIEEDEEMRMPPTESKYDITALSPDEITLVKEWINAMGKTDAPVNTQVDPEEKKPITIKQRIAYLHPVVIHFPIACIIAAFLAELLLFFKPGIDWLNGARRWSLWLGSAGAVASAFCGWQLADVLGYSESIFNHRWLGIASMVLAIFATIANERIDRKTKKVWIVRILLLIAAGLVAASGHTGGEIVHDYIN